MSRRATARGCGRTFSGAGVNLLWRCAILCIATLGWAAEASAHKPSDAYLRLSLQGAQVSGRIDVALRDLEQALALDANNDGVITWGEVRERETEVVAYVTGRITVRSPDGDCPWADPAPLEVAEHTDGAYASLPVRAICSAGSTSRGLVYRLFADLDSTHRGLVSLGGSDGGRQTLVLAPGPAVVPLSDAVEGASAQVRALIKEGIWHIWIGLDHILFLLALLFPAVLRRHQGTWIAATELRPVLSEVLKIVTAFTIAHSITLSLAAVGVMRLPSQWVESAIAASVIIAAVNNLYPFVQRSRWSVAFFLGLLHGFGFFGVLADMGLGQGNLALSLIGFNVGVEIGQLCIVAAFVPLAFWLRGSWAYQRLTVHGGSAAIAVVALLWSVERVFELKLLTF